MGDVVLAKWFADASAAIVIGHAATAPDAARAATGRISISGKSLFVFLE